jgi:SpoVK/Ycf46/Vps4 family AAA+-type ATPase
MLYKNKSSQKVYVKLKEFEQEHDGYIYEMISIQRLGDNKEYNLDTVSFREKYAKLSPSEYSIFANQLKSLSSGEEFCLKPDIGPSSSAQKIISQVDIGTLYPPGKFKDEHQLVLSDATSKTLKSILDYRKYKDTLHKDWAFNELGFQSERLVLNFYGAPGTGKTASANLLSKDLQLPILHVSYPKVVSKWIGDTGKNIKKCFSLAKKNNAILLFDEADSLVAKRQSADTHLGSYLNRDINILMQELDEFKGIVILTTNFFGNYDEAFLRRIAYHVEFELPSQNMIKQIIKNLIPKKILKTKIQKNFNFDELAKDCNGLSGGDLLNIVTNTIKSVALDSCTNSSKKFITLSDFKVEVKSVQKAKKSHSGNANRSHISLV